MFRLRYVVLFLLSFSGLLLSSGIANASFSSTIRDGYNTLSDNVAETWQEPEHYDLYVPAITWHARFAYDKEKTDEYNERPLGGPVSACRAGMIKVTGTAST
ncbi:Lipid A palmitoyltransferase PagP precursor [Raoultella terrigena]|uniref:Lipid A palmitoyltransferase PagP n=1 Tax=Raoultella terrigena TaxID=577 RepID=A0A485BHN9_RAOTE|nr:Lipid A palmitoyltransferase PagP precursor [Raoultella terrigena]